ncbi:nucleolar protein 14 [Dimargaris cristalligena]|uniref:Nucleolar protein 14 n=1 Tax=Dimargaris cristalligena TaxID=215637 RepID=A0A4P9ZUY3_9FUNG|nr:nucleolar protein 14 [Dimargaris cristalligena]|eukprot:RKP37078.1 nucleolar protein 14 [Dimargaris cristalligena]
MVQPEAPKSNQSALKRLRASLRESGITGGKSRVQKRPGNKKKGGPGAAADTPNAKQRAAKLNAIGAMFNPFEIKHNKTSKAKVLGQNRKGEKGRPAMSKQIGQDNRKKTLLVEWQNRNKAGGLVDHRLGEHNPHMTADERMAERYTQERLKHLRGGDVFNLDQDDVLTHKGRPLTEIDDFDEIDLRGPELEGDDGEDGGVGALADRKGIDKTTVRSAHFGNFHTDEQSPMEAHQQNKTKAEVMKELIAKSKMHKMERQQAREEDDDLRHELDDDFKDIRSLLLSGEGVVAPPTDDTDLDLTGASAKDRMLKTLPDQDDDYNQYLQQLALERRAPATDRQKTEEELLMEAKEKLERAERHRVRRMAGQASDTEGSDSDDDDGGDNDAFGGSKSNQRGAGPKRLPQGDDLDGDFAEGASHPLEGMLSRGLQLRKEGKLNDAASDSEDDEDDDEEESGGDDQSDEDEAVFDQEGLSDSDEDDADADDAGTSKATGPAAGTPKGPIPRPAVEEMPYTFPAPETYEQFADLLEGRTIDQQTIILERLRVLYHVQLAPENKQHLRNLFRALYVHVHIRVSDDSQAPLQHLDVFVRHLTELAPMFPELLGELATEQLRNFHGELTSRLQSPAGQFADVFPEATDLLQFKLLTQLLSVSDFQHPIITPLQLVLSQYLQQYTPRSFTDIVAGLFVCHLMLDMQRLSRRFCPEVHNYLQLVLAALHDPVMSETKIKGRPSITRTWADCGLFPLPNGGLEQFSFLNILSNNTKLNQVQYAKPRLMQFFDESTLPTTDAERSATLVGILGTTVQLLVISARTYMAFPSFIELFSPIVNHLRLLPAASLSPSVMKVIQNARTTLGNFLQQHFDRRQPLQLQKHKAVPIPSYLPKFQENYNLDRSYDPDRARAEHKRLQRVYKKEMRGAIRELRKDTDFIQTERLKEAKQADTDYKRRIGGIVGSLQEQQKELTKLDRIAEREKKRKRTRH